MKTIYQRVTEIVMSIGVTEKEINLKAVFSTDLGLDSLDMAELITLCEEEFEVEIPDLDVCQFVRVGDIVQYIEDRFHPAEKPKAMYEEWMISRIAAFVGVSKFRKLP